MNEEERGRFEMKFTSRLVVQESVAVLATTRNGEG